MNLSNVSVGMKPVDEKQFSGPPCPGCGKPTLPGKQFCYKCNSFMDPAGTRILKPEEVTLSQVEEVIACSQREENNYENDTTNLKAKKVAVCGAIGALISPLVMLLNLILGILVLGVCLWAIISYPRRASRPWPAECLNPGDFEEVLSKYLAPAILKNAMDQLEVYDPKQYIPYEFVDRTGLITSPYNSYGGSCYARGVYHGIPMEFSNVHLADVTEDEDGKQHRRGIFCGLWLICDLGTDLSAEVRILKGHSGQNRIETDHEEFNRRFSVFSQDRNAAFRFLTPQVMEAILRADDYSGGHTKIFAMKDGHVCAACDTGNQILTFRDTKEPISQIREKMEEEIQNLLTFADIIGSARVNK